MSVILEFAMFPTGKGESVSAEVSKIIKFIDQSGYPYQLTPMATIIETDTFPEALKLVEQAYEQIESDTERVYSVMKFDIRKGKLGRMKQKIQSIESKIGSVRT
ncbi:MAG: MTH1187 family thiamine-binding protein [Opitutales bacterium]|nr:MTH1187 family thiamine-binding protein [Opitutales bacterium]